MAQNSKSFIQENQSSMQINHLKLWKAGIILLNLNLSDQYWPHQEKYVLKLTVKRKTLTQNRNLNLE